MVTSTVKHCRCFDSVYISFIVLDYVVLLDTVLRKCTRAASYLDISLTVHHELTQYTNYSKTCLKRNAIVPVFFSPVFTGFGFTKGCVLIKQSTKNMIA